MVLITPDIGKNRLIIEFRGRPQLADLPVVEATLREAVARLRPPFDVLSDVSQLETLAGVPLDQLARMGELLRTAGVRRVVRVVGKSVRGTVMLERLGRLIHTSAHLAFSRAEAEAVLDGSTPG